MQTIVGHDQETCLTKGSPSSTGIRWAPLVIPGLPSGQAGKQTCIQGHTVLQISRVRDVREESIPRKDSGAKAKQEWAVRSFPGPWYLLVLQRQRSGV